MPGKKTILAGAVEVPVGVLSLKSDSFSQYHDNLLKDLDSNIYTTIDIGTQRWIVENFRCTKFADGSDIPIITDNTLWAANVDGAMCYYANNINNATIYGGLYNGYSVINAKGLAKLIKNGINQSYRIPTDVDWDNLNDYLGGYTVAGGKLKETGLAHWKTPNTGATNETGFTGLPGGFRYDHGLFSGITENGNFTSTNLHRKLHYASIYNFPSSYSNNHGISIRLLKDI